MGIIRARTFSSILSGCSPADSLTNSPQYRDELIHCISNGTPNNELSARAYDEYLRDHPLEKECIRSFGLQNKLMLPTHMSRSVAAALLADSQLLPLVNCSHLACNVPCSHDDCYISVQWRDENTADAEEWFQRSHRFNCRPLHITIDRRLILDALRRNDYTAICDNLRQSHIGDAFDNGFVSTCADLPSRQPTQSHYLPQPEPIDVSESDFADWRFWQSLAPLRAATISGRSVWVMHGLTAIDIMTLEGRTGNRLVEANAGEGTWRLLGCDIIQPRKCCMHSFDRAENGDVFAMLVDPVGFTVNLMPGLPLYLSQEDPTRQSSSCLDVIFPCDGVVTDSRGWLTLRKK